MTLVDTSIWVDHLRKGTPTLGRLLQEKQVLTHPWIIGELACGMLRNRNEILTLLQDLPQAQIADDHEVFSFIETYKLFGKELGWVDVNLLASAQLTGCTLWTTDKSLKNSTEKLRLD